MEDMQKEELKKRGRSKAPTFGGLMFFYTRVHGTPLFGYV